MDNNRNNLPPALQNLLRNPAVRGENGRFQARSAQAAQERREERRHRTLLETIKDGATVAVATAKQTGQNLPGGSAATAVGGVYGAAANELMQAVSWVKLDRFKRDKPPETTTINNDNSNTNSSNSSNSNVSTRITRNERPQGVNPPRTSNSESDSEERRPRGRPRNSSNPLAGLQGRARAIRRREIQADNASIRATRELRNLNESTDEATQADRTQHREIIDRLKGIIKAIRSLKPFGGMPRLGGLGGGRGRGRNGRNGRNTRRGANGGYDGDNDRDRTRRNRGNRNNRNDEDEDEQRRPRNSSNPLAGLQGRARAIRRREIQADNASIRATRELQNLNESTDEATQADRTQHREIIDRLKGIIKAIRSLQPLFGGIPRLGGFGGGGRGRNGRGGRNAGRGANGGYERSRRDRGNRDDQRRRDDIQRRWDERKARRVPDGGKKRGKWGRLFDWGKDKAGKALELGKDKAGKFSEWAGGATRKGGGVVAGIGKKIGKVRGLGAIGSLLALAGIASTEMDDTLTREEKNREHGATAGRAATGLAGAAAGAAIGTMIFPGVGTVIGGIVGGIAADYFSGDAAAELGSEIADWLDNASLSELPGRIVDKVGEWTSLLMNSDMVQSIKDKFGEWTQSLKDTEIGKYITENWGALTTDIAAKWDAFTNILADTWKNLKEGTQKTLEGVNDWIKDKTGIDAGAGLAAAGNAVIDAAAAVYNGAKEMASDAVSATKEAVTSAYDYTKEAASEVMTGRKYSVNERWSGGARDDIVAAAKATGMDAGVLANIAHYESMGFNHNARPVSKSKPRLNTVRQFDGTMAMSSAHGYGQFTDATWMDTLNKHGSKHGVKGAGSLSKDQANAFRTDRKLQAIMLAEFSKDNIATAKKYGGTDDLANAYALHNLGGGDEGGGAKFLKAMAANPNAKVNSVLSREVIERNTGLYGKSGDKTLAEAYKGMSEFMHEGDSYAKEASNLQNGITAPTAGGVIASAANMAAGASSLYDKGKAWADGAMPNATKVLRVKASDGSTKTLDQLGISSHSELQSKGGQAFQGGYNDPATLFATSLIQNGMGENFDRVTAQNDAYHSAKSPGSDHTKGTKTDFTVKGMSGKDADLKTAEIMAKWGLQKGVDFETINEYDKPSAKATGGHIDFKLREEGQAKIAKIMAMEKAVTAKPVATTAAETNTGYYDYGQSTTASTTAVARQESAIPAIAPVKTPDPLPQTAMQPPAKAAPTHPLEQFKQGGQQSPVIDTASITKAITAGFAGIKPQQSGLEQSKQGFASHIPVDIDDAYWLRATNGSFT